MNSPLSLVVSLRALLLSAAAILPLYAWHVVDLYLSRTADSSWAEPTTTEVALTYGQFAFRLLVIVVGTVVVTVGTTLAWQRDGLRPMTFVAGSLAVSSIFVGVSLAGLALELSDASRQFDPSLESALTFAVLVHTGTLVGVALAARLYLHWRQPAPDPRDGKRFVALSVTSIVIAVAQGDTILTVIGAIESVPISVIYTARYFLWALIDAAGAVFVFGMTAILVLRRIGKEHERTWILTAGGLAALVSWIVLQDPGWFQMGVEHYGAALIWTIAAGVVGGIIYMLAMDPELVGRLISSARAMADVPATIRRLRNWSIHGDEDR